MTKLISITKINENSEIFKQYIYNNEIIIHRYPNRKKKWNKNTKKIDVSAVNLLRYMMYMKIYISDTSWINNKTQKYYEDKWINS